jgi:hypothetical protein
LVPADPDRDELYLLREAVDLVKDVDYGSGRRAFHGAQLAFVENGHTDFESMKTAVESMDESLKKLMELTRKRRFRSALRNGFFFTQVAADLVVPGSGTAAKGVETAITIGKYTASNVLQNPANPHHNGLAGALLVDAQRQLDLTLEGERDRRRFKDLRRWWRRRRRSKRR